MNFSGSAGLAPADLGFSGLRFYSNGDAAKAALSLPKVSGRYRVTVRGASSTESRAGISVFLGESRTASLFFSGKSPATAESLVDVHKAPSPNEIRLVLESDNGSNDTDIDWMELAYLGEIPPPPPPPVPPAQGAYSNGQYRNLFAGIGKKPDEISAKLKHAWDKLFYGGAEETIYYPVGEDMAYILDVGNNDIRSEGMSYGMMIAVQMGKKNEFDRLWKFAKTKMQHQDPDRKGYFAWQVRTDGSHMDAGSASDGEEYFAMALFFASHRWGEGQGIFAYKKEAQQILDAMLHQADDGRGVNMFDKARKQVVFSPIGSAAGFTDPSYHLPAFYELWALWADKDNGFWKGAADTSRAFFKRTTHPKTGLGPDYAEFSGVPNNTGGHGEFRFDAWRIAMNIAVDYAWWAKDPWQKKHADSILGFFHQQGIKTYANQYELSGKPLSTDHSPGLVAMNATAALASTRSEAWEFVQEMWDLEPPSGKWRYYDGTLYMMGLLHVAGAYRIIRPGDGVSLSTAAAAESVGNRSSSREGAFARGLFGELSRRGILDIRGRQTRVGGN